MQPARGSDRAAWVLVVVQGRDPARGRLRFGSIGPFYAESVLRRVLPFYWPANGTASRV
jgi:hypothetical protein